jgi:hypothetical protein
MPPLEGPEGGDVAILRAAAAVSEPVASLRKLESAGLGLPGIDGLAAAKSSAARLENGARQPLLRACGAWNAGTAPAFFPPPTAAHMLRSASAHGPTACPVEWLRSSDVLCASAWFRGTLPHGSARVPGHAGKAAGGSGPAGADGHGRPSASCRLGAGHAACARGRLLPSSGTSKATSQSVDTGDGCFTGLPGANSNGGVARLASTSRGRRSSAE